MHFLGFVVVSATLRNDRAEQFDRLTEFRFFAQRTTELGDV